MTKEEAGIYEKFIVKRTDGRHRKGQKHCGCAYFVLDITHDKHALPALLAYAESCLDEYPALSQNLYAIAHARDPHHAASRLIKTRGPKHVTERSKTNG